MGRKPPSRQYVRGLSSRAARRVRLAPTTSLAAALLLLLPAWAAAFDLDLRMRGQIVGLGAFSLPDPGFGTAEVQVNASIWSVGAALGVAYERYPSPDEDVLNGGAFQAAFQWRFMALIDRHVFAWFDPHIDLGMKLGGARGERGGERWFRGVGYGRRKEKVVQAGSPSASRPQPSAPCATGALRPLVQFPRIRNETCSFFHDAARPEQAGARSRA